MGDYMKNTEHRSADDDIENTRKKSIVERVDQTKLAEDHDTPAAPANTTSGSTLPGDHPIKDSPVDSSEVYEEGEEGIVYTPANRGSDTSDQRKEIEKGREYE